MKKIGFVDYYISEWHANNYPEWIDDACKKMGLDYKVSYAWAEERISPIDGVTTEEWCKKFGAEKCNTLEELCEKSDVILVLAPSDPEKHLQYAKTVLKYGKRTYIDKTFAPCLDEAKDIFALAERYNTPFFSTSALRYASELEKCENCNRIKTVGGGSNLCEYIIHQVEMVVHKLGIGATHITAKETENNAVFSIKYPDQREASMTFAYNGSPFIAEMSNCKDTFSEEIQSNFFGTLMEKILTFFETGKSDFSGEETLEVMKIRDGVFVSEKSPEKCIEL